MSTRRLLLLFLVHVPAFNLLTVLALPTAINALVRHRIISRAVDEAAKPDPRPAVQARKAEILARGGINIALPAPRADAEARTVVRPSPDLLYTACAFDLSRGPLQLTALVPDSYLSISGFAADSSNFFAVNDRDAVSDADGQRRLEIVLSRSADVRVPDGARLVVAPDDRGLVLFRTLIVDEAALPELQARYQAAQRCAPL